MGAVARGEGECWRAAPLALRRMWMPWRWDHLPVCIPSKLEPVTWEDHSPAPLALEEGSELVSDPSHQAERGVPFPVCCPWESFPSTEPDQVIRALTVMLWLGGRRGGTFTRERRWSSHGEWQPQAGAGPGLAQGGILLHFYHSPVRLPGSPGMAAACPGWAPMAVEGTLFSLGSSGAHPDPAGVPVRSPQHGELH